MSIIIRYLIVAASILCKLIYAGAQTSEIALEMPATDFVFRNLENQIKVVVEGKSCNELMFNVTNASYKWSGCTLIIQPHDAAISCTIEIMDQSAEIIATRSLFIREFPEPTPQIAGRGPLDFATDMASIKESKEISLIYPELRNYKNFQPWSILSFNLRVVYSSGIEVNYANVGSNLNSKSLEALSNVGVGSYVIISKILCIDYKGEERFLPDINLMIE